MHGVQKAVVEIVDNVFRTYSSVWARRCSRWKDIRHGLLLRHRKQSAKETRPAQPRRIFGANKHRQTLKGLPISFSGTGRTGKDLRVHGALGISLPRGVSMRLRSSGGTGGRGRQARASAIEPADVANCARDAGRARPVAGGEVPRKACRLCRLFGFCASSDHGHGSIRAGSSCGPDSTPPTAPSQEPGRRS